MKLGKLQGKTISKVTAELQADFETSDRYGIATGQTFILTGPGGTYEINPEGDPANHGVAQNLVGKTVESAEADEQTGVLTLRLSNGWSLTVGPHDGYEGWDFSGPNGTEIVCMPDGKLAIFEVDKSSD